MAFDKFKDKVAQTRDKLQEQSDKLTDQATGQLDRAKEAGGKLKEQAGEQAGLMAEAGNKLSEFGQEKIRGAVQSLLEEMNGLLPLLQNSGFIVGDVILTGSLPPALGIVIEQRERGSAHLEDALGREDLTRTQSAVLKSIKRVYDLNDLVEKYEHTVGQVEVELSIPPSVKAHLNSVKSRAFATAESS